MTATGKGGKNSPKQQPNPFMTKILRAKDSQTKANTVRPRSKKDCFGREDEAPAEPQLAWLRASVDPRSLSHQPTARELFALGPEAPERLHEQPQLVASSMLTRHVSEESSSR